MRLSKQMKKILVYMLRGTPYTVHPRNNIIVAIEKGLGGEGEEMKADSLKSRRSSYSRSFKKLEELGLIKTLSKVQIPIEDDDGKVVSEENISLHRITDSELGSYKGYRHTKEGREIAKKIATEIDELYREFAFLGPKSPIKCTDCSLFKKYNYLKRDLFWEMEI